MPRALSHPRPKLLPGTLVDWRAALGSHYLRLGRASRQRRFMASLPDQTMRQIADSASPDIVLGIESDGRVVGVLELFKGPDDHAEIGISVEDAYQGRGFGKALFLDGLVAAERIGVKTADLYFASENRGIRRLVLSAGGEITQFGPECEAHIDLSRFAANRRKHASRIDEIAPRKAAARMRVVALKQQDGSLQDPDSNQKD